MMEKSLNTISSQILLVQSVNHMLKFIITNNVLFNYKSTLL